MTETPPLKKRNHSLTLVATFLIGVGIGASLTYAALEAAGVNFSREKTTSTATRAADDDQAPETDDLAIDETEEAAPPVERHPVAELLADVTGQWPARHLFVVLPRAPLPDATLEWLRIYKPGGVILQPDSLRSVAQTLEVVRSVKQSVGLGLSPDSTPLIIFDPAKSAFQNLGLESVPSPQSLGAMNEESLAEKAGQDLGAALAQRGFGMVVGPVLDVYEPGVSEPWLANLAFGPKPSLVAAIGLAYGQGIEAGGVLPILAHYPGLGHARYDDSGLYHIPHADLRALAELMFPFSKAAAESFPAMLVSHAAVPILDEDDPQRPAALSPVLVKAVIRDTWQFEGAIIADDVTQHAMTRDIPVGDAVAQALAAGCDGVIVSGMDMEKFGLIASAMKEALRENRLTTAGLNASKARLDALQQRIPAIGPLFEPASEGEEAGDEEDIVIEADVQVTITTPSEDDVDVAPEGSDDVAEEEGAEEEEEQSESNDETVEPAEATATTPAPRNSAGPRDSDGPLTNYTVKTGDNLRKIAEAHNTSVDALVRINGLSSPDVIRIGQRLKVPAAKQPGGGT